MPLPQLLTIAGSGCHKEYEEDDEDGVKGLCTSTISVSRAGGSVVATEGFSSGVSVPNVVGVFEVTKSMNSEPNKSGEKHFMSN